MRHPIRTLALALARAATPACAALRASNPIAAAEAVDQRAYALIGAYAALLEEAADVVRDPSVPLEAKRALGAAERAATPAVETLQIAAAAYASAEAEIAAGGDASALNRLAIAARHLNEALAQAEPHVATLRVLLNKS